ncbi:hypothetical protein SMICM17S_06803 [Streptomyces microflavus]
MRTEEVLAAIATGLWRWDNAAGTVTLDAEAARLLGLPAEPGSYREAAVRSRFHPVDWNEIYGVVNLAVAEGTLAEARLRIVDERERCCVPYAAVRAGGRAGGWARVVRGLRACGVSIGRVPSSNAGRAGVVPAGLGWPTGGPAHRARTGSGCAAGPGRRRSARSHGGCRAHAGRRAASPSRPATLAPAVGAIVVIAGCICTGRLWITGWSTCAASTWPRGPPPAPTCAWTRTPGRPSATRTATAPERTAPRSGM